MGCKRKGEDESEKSRGGEMKRISIQIGTKITKINKKKKEEPQFNQLLNGTKHKNAVKPPLHNIFIP